MFERRIVDAGKVSELFFDKIYSCDPRLFNIVGKDFL
jgi:hypothetical protein